MTANMEIVGSLPELAGLVCEALVSQAFVCNGELVSNANGVHLRFAGIWYKLVIDAGVIFWRKSAETPQPWAVVSEGWEYPHIDVGADAGVIGVHLTGYEMVTSATGGRVMFQFENGNRIVVENNNDRTELQIEVRTDSGTVLG